jgi:hypothetical protein
MQFVVFVQTCDLFFCILYLFLCCITWHKLQKLKNELVMIEKGREMCKTSFLFAAMLTVFYLFWFLFVRGTTLVDVFDCPLNQQYLWFMYFVVLMQQVINEDVVQDDIDEEFQEDDIGDEFEVDDLGDELQDKLE